MRAFHDPYRPDEPPLPAWDAPRPGEPAHGFVVRHVGLNGRASVRTTLIGHGLNGRSIRPDECLEFALSLPFRDREALVHATPVVSADRVAVMGQVVRRRQWQIERRRFCPACLAEDAYHRAWWDLLAFRRCPHHDIDLVDRDAGGRPVPWWFPSFERSPSGHALGRPGLPRRESPTPSPEAYVLGRLGAAGSVRVPFLDGMTTLGHALDAIRLLGRVALWGTDAARPTNDREADGDAARAGYAVAVGGEEALLTLFHRVADARTSGKSGRTKRSCFGWIAEDVWGQEQGDHIDALDRILDRVMLERNLPDAGPGRPSPDGDWITLPRLAEELALPVGALRRASCALGIHAVPQKGMRNRYLAFGPEEARRIRDAVVSTVDRDAAASMLGLSRACVGALASIGLLRPVPGIDGRKGLNRFEVQDVRALEDRLLLGSREVAVVPEGFSRVGMKARSRNFDPVRFLVRALEAGAPSLCRAGSQVGDLLVPGVPPKAAMAEARAAIRKRPGISRHEAASLAGVGADVIDALVAAGLLTAVDDAGSKRRINRRSVESFRRVWATAGLYREILGLKDGDRRAGARLMAMGVASRRLAVTDGRFTVLARRASARKVLGLAYDPDAQACGGIPAFEAALLAALATDSSFVRVGQIGRLGLASSDNDLALCVDVRPDESLVVVTLRRYTAYDGLDAVGRASQARTLSRGSVPASAIDGSLVAEMRLEAAELSEPTEWSALVDRVSAAIAVFRKAFPRRRRPRQSLPPSGCSRRLDIGGPSEALGQGHPEIPRAVPGQVATAKSSV